MMLEILCALAPIIIIIILMFFFRMPALYAMPLIYIITLIIAMLVWQMDSAWIAAASVKGFFSALELILIIFGALLLLNIMKSSGAIVKIDNTISSLSRDRRIQTILIGWFFVAFVESISGFGTPAALAAPFLVALGFNPLAAVMVALIGDGVATTFGAAGTPILIGMTNALNSKDFISMFSASGTSLDTIIRETAVNAAIINGIISIIMPLAMVIMLTYFFDKNLRAGLKIWPFAILSGLCFSVPYVLIAIFLGPEFPSIIGSVVGFLLVVFFIKIRFLVPKEIYRFKHDIDYDVKEKKNLLEINAFKAFLPYVIVIILLFITRIPQIGLKVILQQITIGIDRVFMTNISASIPYLYNPGTMFIIASLFALVIYRRNIKSYKDIFYPLKNIYKPFITLAFTIALVQIMVNSGVNNSNLPSMPIVLGSLAASLGSILYFFASPFIGVLGAFLTGSNTMSNLLFSPLQATTAHSLGIKPSLILSLQTVGGAIGNMICIFNVVAAYATVNMHEREFAVIKLNLIPAIIHALLAGIIGLCMYYFWIY